jgi:uroporphyrinogen III methyltransferase/synthase
MSRPERIRSLDPGGSEKRAASGKRERILDAAASLFAGRDLSLVTMEEVAARAGVAKGTLYNHFASKEDLYFSILTARMAHLCEAMRGILAEERSAGAGLRKYVVHTMMFLMKYPDFFRILRRERAILRTSAPAEIHDLRDELRGILRSFLSRGIEDGTVRAVPLDLATDLLLGAIEGSAVRCIEVGCAPHRGLPEAESVFDLLWRSLAARDPGAPSGELSGARVLVTREEESEDGLGREIVRLGGEVVHLSLLRTVPPEDSGPLKAAVAQASRYDWILFTSARGVEAFSGAGGDAAACGAARIGAVGEATARRTRDLLGRCDLIGESAGGEGLAASLRSTSTDLAGMRILLPRSAEARAELPSILRSAGARVDEVIAYRVIPADEDVSAIGDALSAGEIDVVTFASGSAARAFAERLGRSMREAGGRRARIASIGPSTSETLRALALAPDAEAASPSWAHLAQAALRAFRKDDARGAQAEVPGA